MKTVALPALLLVALIVAGVTWLLWPTPLEQALSARARGDATAALARLRPLAQAGDAAAQAALGQMLAKGEGTPKDVPAALNWWRKAAAQRHPGAALDLGDRFSSGDGVPADPVEALRWYRFAAETGELAGLKRIIALGDRGDARAQLEAGRLFAAGIVLAADKREAARWFHLAAAQGNADAREALLALMRERVPDAAYLAGQLYERGEGVRADPAQAAAAYAVAAEGGHMLAQLRFAEMQAQGRGVPRNDTLAAQWYARAAKQGHAGAQLAYARLLQRGQGVPRNDAEAVHWFTEAANNGESGAVAALHTYAAAGDAAAQLALGLAYAQGKAAPRDAAQSFEWLRRAAEQGAALAQFEVAFRYAAGEGTAKNPARAAHWYGAAVRQGSTNAVIKLRQLAVLGEPVAEYEYGRYLANGGPPPVVASDQIDDLVHAIVRRWKAWRHDPVAEGVTLLRAAAAAGNADARAELARLKLP